VDGFGLFDEIGDSSIAIIEHRFSPRLKDREVNGRFCVEWNGFRRDDQGLDCLSRWRAQCIEWCYYRLEDGKMGEIVITHIDKDSCPMVRFRTGDLSIRSRFPCECGQSLLLPKGVIGSAKEMIKVKGVKVYLSQIDSIMKSVSGAESNYRIIIRREGDGEKFGVLIKDSGSKSYNIRQLREELKGCLLINPDDIQVVENLPGKNTIIDYR